MTDLPHKVAGLILQKSLIEEGDLVVAAVSGGADSLTLLHILSWLKKEKVISFFLHVAHLNHGLRGKAALEDLHFVRREARKLGLPFTAGLVEAGLFQKRHGFSPEDAARRLRYNYLQQLSTRLGAKCLAVGHNLDDQAETVLLNLLRGTGPDGLAGMKYKRKMGGGANLLLIRPLLETSRGEIDDYCREKGLSPRLDHTNLERRFLRNKVRLDLIPYLERNYNSNLRQGLFRLSSLVALDNYLLEKLAAQRLAELTIGEGSLYLRLEKKGLLREDEALQGRILRAAIRRLLDTVPREIGLQQIGAILKLCEGGFTRGELSLPRKLKVYRSFDALTLSLEEPGQNTFVPFYINVPGKAGFPLGEGALTAEIVDPEVLQWPPDSKKEAYLDYDKVKGFAGELQESEEGKEGFCLLVRPRLQGDRFYPLGAPGAKKIKKYFIDQKVPFEMREQLPLILAGNKIIWVAGYQIAHDCKITKQSKKVLLLRLMNAKKERAD
jgi:tRNA(Ile)-lysidine synthase